MRGDQIGGPIRWRMHLLTAPEAVYQALDSRRGRESFWAESAAESEGHIQFLFPNGFRHAARILERRRPELWSIEYFGGPLRFEISPDGEGGTDLSLSHEGVRAAEWQEVHAGWLNVLFPMKAWLDHRIDLRNHDPERTWDQGYADA